MSWSDEGYDKAEWTFGIERTANGQDRHLPWARVKFDGPGEQQKYVVPVQRSGAARSGASTLGFTPYRQYREVMPNRPFPLTSAGPLSDSTSAPGPLGVHFFGGV